MLLKDIGASVQHLFRVVASVLHLGNVHFDADSKGHAMLRNNTELNWVSDVRSTNIHHINVQRRLRNTVHITTHASFPYSFWDWMPTTWRRDLCSGGLKPKQSRFTDTKPAFILSKLKECVSPYCNCDHVFFLRFSVLSQLTTPSMSETPWPKPSMDRPLPGWSAGLMSLWRIRWEYER